MSRLGDFFNRIRSRFVPEQKLQIPAKSAVNPVLKENMDQYTLDYFANPNNYNEYCRAFFNDAENLGKQYDYLEIVSLMQANGAMADFEKYFIEVQNNPSLYYPSQVHGIDHTSRVTFFAEMLCSLDGLSDHDRDLVMKAAQLHDIGREDDKKNFDHGLASKYKIEQYGLLSQYSKKDQDVIKFAVECHSLEPDQIEEKINSLPRRDRKQYRKILDYLQDADKLDRTRIANKGWGLDPTRLATDTAKRLVRVAHINYSQFKNVIDYEVNKDRYEIDYNNRLYALNQVREKGFNISMDDLNSIIEEYEPGTFEMLLREGRVEDIFSYETLQKYGTETALEEIDSIHDEMFQEVGFNDQIEMTTETFDDEFMLHYNLKYNHPDSYNLYKHADVDISSRAVAGVMAEMQISDLDKLFARGYRIRSTDLIYLAANLTPEEYRDVIDSGRVEDLFSSKYEKHAWRYDYVQKKLASHGINYSKETIDTSYRFIEKIIDVCPDVLKDPNISNYSFPEIYAAVSKIWDASTRFSNDTPFRFTEKDVIEFMDYSRKDNIIYHVSEKEQLDVTENFMQDRTAVTDPRYIQYLVKRNKPFTTKRISEILNYNEFCADKILVDPNITLDEAKARLINGLFNLDVPPENRPQFEKELMEQLYFHKKYYPQSPLYQEGDNPTSKIAEILSATNIKDFKELLYQSKKEINFVNTHNLGDMIKSELIDISRSDITNNLQKTANEIHSMESTMVYSESGIPVQAKVLSGQGFYLATSTVMPRCSAFSNRLKREYGDAARDKIYEQMLQRQIDPHEICTSIVSNNMIAHASSALQDQELVFGFVPESKDSVSIAGVYDLSSTKKGGTIRRTNRPITPRSISDFVSGTTEEHNEAVMDAYPDFIICYDKISDIAIEKQKKMQAEYDSLGIGKKIEIVLVEAEKTYLPQIKGNVLREHEAIEQKLESGTLTEQDFALMFERHESNFVLRTLQAIHSGAYRDNTWDTDFNGKVLESMTRILGKVSEIVPPEKAKAVLNQVNILLQRSDRNTDYGSRVYDHAYDREIDTISLGETKDKLLSKVRPYEQSRNQEETKQPKRELILEEMDTGGISQNRSGPNVDTKDQKETHESPDDDAR